jgi:hypothetical protein
MLRTASVKTSSIDLYLVSYAISAFHLLTRSFSVSHSSVLRFFVINADH